MNWAVAFNDDHEILRPRLMAPDFAAHKYSRGSVLVFSGPALRGGAARLSAQAALGVGAGLVTLVGDKDALKIHAAHVTAIMLQVRDSVPSSIDSRISSFAIGPGYGTGEECRLDVLTLAGQGRPMVIDADGITAFEANPQRLFSVLHSQVVLTPHDGEFARLFPDIALTDRMLAAQTAAQRAGAVILLKGAATIIATPDGRHGVNRHGNGWLATAGSGDVLTGLIAGIMAQGTGAFRAACIAAWLHGELAVRHGPGLTADRMIGLIPAALTECLIDKGQE